MRIKLSVIILNYNTADLLSSCLSAVLASKGFERGQLEVIAVDNNSSDNSVEMVMKDYPAVKLIRNERNLGFSAGNNTGIKVARGKFLLLLNSDTLVEPDVLIGVLKMMESDASIGAATCLLQTGDGKLDPASHRGFPTPWNSLSYFLGLEKLFPGSRLFGGYHQGWKNLRVPHDVDCISAAFMMIRAQVIEKVGFLDEKFFMYGEDIDWCLRIKNAGYRILFYPGVKTLHLKRRSGREQTRDRDLRKRTQNMFLDSMWQFYEKHYLGKYPLLLNWLVKIGIKVGKLL